MRFASFVALAAFLAAPMVAAVDLPLVGYVAFVKEGDLTTVPNAADGVYASHNESHLAYYGTLDAEVPTALDKRDILASRQNTCDVSCNGDFGSASNIQGANNGMASLLAANPNFSGSIAYVFANVWAFGCDYGNGQSESVSQWNFDVGCTNAGCTTSGAGWNSHRQWRSTYGRRFGGFGC